LKASVLRSWDKAMYRLENREGGIAASGGANLARKS